ncbi:MAG: hypothetical protein KC503_18940 [Myxococcales bacterium]|nr:hypothetical protein [Myxococcales bacterium]
MRLLGPHARLRAALALAAIALAAIASGCSFDFDRFDRPCLTDNDCVESGTCDALRGVCAPTRYFRPAATVETYAGSGDPGATDGARAQSTFNSPSGLVFVSASELVVADRGSHRLRSVTDGGVTLRAGLEAGFADGAPLDARFTLPSALAFAQGDLYIADTGNHRIRALSSDMVSSLTGGASGFVDGALADARFDEPLGIAVLPDRRIVVADRQNHRVRIIDLLTDSVETLAGRAGGGFADGAAADALFRNPAAVAVDTAGRVIVADSGNNRVRAITIGAQAGSATVETLAGGEAGFSDGAAAEARFSSPQGVAVVGSTIYVADTLNARVRVIEDGQVHTLCGGGSVESVDGPASSARLQRPVGIAASADGKAIYIADQQGHRIRRVLLP